MADVIASNHSLILVLPRFGIRLGFGEQSVREVCDRYGLDVEFVLMVFNVYSFDDYIPEEEYVVRSDMRPLVPYLKASHHYYLKERLPHIERHLDNIAAHAGDPYGAILKKFIVDYKSEVQAHFSFEEKYVYPLLTPSDHQSVPSDKADHFADNHSDMVDKLLDLTQIVYKYIPGESMTEDLNELVYGVMQLSSDLEKHAVLEEKVLLPYLRKIQSQESR